MKLSTINQIVESILEDGEHSIDLEIQEWKKSLGAIPVKPEHDGGITFKNWTINQTGTIDCFATWGNNIPPSRKNPTLLDDLDLLFCTENNS